MARHKITPVHLQWIAITLFAAMMGTLGCDSTPKKIQPTPAPSTVKAPNEIKTPPKRLNPTNKKMPAKVVDPAKLAEAQKLVAQGEVLMKRGNNHDVQEARKVFYQATRAAPKLSIAHIALAEASLTLGNKKGATLAAREGLFGAKTLSERLRALVVLRRTSSKQGAYWEKPSFYDEYIAQNARLLPESQRAPFLKGVSSTVIKSVARAHTQRRASIAKQLCTTPKIVGPVTSPKALCEVFEAEHKDAKCKWGKSPEVTSALQVLPLTVEREDGSVSYMAIGKKNMWRAVWLTERRHATSGYVHESLKTRLYSSKRAGDVVTLRAAARKRRGDEDALLGMFYKSEDIAAVWCVLETSLTCKRFLTRAHRSIYATKLSPKTPRHTLLTAYGLDRQMSWENGPQALPESCALSSGSKKK